MVPSLKKGSGAFFRYLIQEMDFIHAGLCLTVEPGI